MTTRTITMRNYQWVLLGLCLVSAPWMALSAAESERLPNIVLIFNDDQGYSDVGCYGARGFTTPHMDRLAREGTRFTNFHVSQPVCSASRTSLLTGCYANRLGIHGALGPKVKHGIHDQETTIAEILKARGYATGMAGKWHLGHHPQFLPTRHGFDEYYGLPYSNDMWPYRRDLKLPDYPNLPLIEGEKIIDDDVTAEDQPRLTTAYAQRAVRFIESHQDRPFFFYLANSMPHVPLYVSEKFRGKSAQGTYGDVIMEIDWGIGQILETLDRLKLAENTLVIMTSDNGPWLVYGDHGGTANPLREGKGTCWEGGVRVPCLMRWPGKIPANKVNDRMWMTIDVLPTLTQLVGGKLPSLPIDGADVWPLWIDRPNAVNPHAAYCYYFEQGALQALVTGDGRWKLQLPHEYRTLAGKPGGTGGMPTRYENHRIAQPELYDLVADIGESRDQSGTHPEVVSQLLSQAAAIRLELGDSLTKTVGKGVRPAGELISTSR